MLRPFRSNLFRSNLAHRSFTLIELLVVMGIIAILASLILYAGIGVIKKGQRSRASAEIAAMSTALDGYKTDNGIYPPSDGVLLTNAYNTYDGTSSNYQTNSTLVFIALTGQNYLGATPAAGVKSYMNLKANQVGNPGGPFSYVKDPWGNSYGYSTATNAAGITPYNGNGFFDLWSTGGEKAGGLQAAWLSNWQ